MSEPMVQGIVACNFASQDKFNRWSLIAIFDTQHVAALPGAIMPHVVWARIADVPTRGEARIQLEKESGTVVWTSGPVSFQMNDPAGSRTIELGFGIPPVAVTSYGKYRYAVLVNDLRAGDLPMNVMPAPITTS